MKNITVIIFSQMETKDKDSKNPSLEVDSLFPESDILSSIQKKRFSMKDLVMITSAFMDTMPVETEELSAIIEREIALFLYRKKFFTMFQEFIHKPELNADLIGINRNAYLYNVYKYIENDLNAEIKTTKELIKEKENKALDPFRSEEYASKKDRCSHPYDIRRTCIGNKLNAIPGVLENSQPDYIIIFTSATGWYMLITRAGYEHFMHPIITEILRASGKYPDYVNLEHFPNFGIKLET